MAPPPPPPVQIPTYGLPTRKAPHEGGWGYHNALAVPTGGSNRLAAPLAVVNAQQLRSIHILDRVSALSGLSQLQPMWTSRMGLDL